MTDNRTATDNRGKALEEAMHAAVEECLSGLSFEPVIRFLSEEFTCDRIYIFVKNPTGTYDMKFEWVKPHLPSKREALVNLTRETVSPYYSRYRESSDSMFVIRNVDELKDADPEMYEMLKPQGVNSLVSAQLSVHGKDLGFLGIDNPVREDVEYIMHLLRSIRNLLSVGIWYSSNREDQAQLSFSRHLTNIGDWPEFYEYAERLDRDRSVAVVFSNLLDLRRINAIRGRQIGDSILIETGHIFTEVFDAECVFRLSGDKHVVLCGGVSYKWMEKRLTKLLSMFRDRDINIEIGAVWEPEWDGNPDSILRRAAMKMRDLSDILEGSVPLEANAEAPLYRNDQFLQNAASWLREKGQARVAAVSVRISHYPLFFGVYGSGPSGTYTRSIGSVMRKSAGKYQGVAGTAGEGEFCLIVPLEGMTENELLDGIRDGIRLANVARGFSPKYGIYISEQRTESVSQMFEYARAAALRATEFSPGNACIITERQVAQLTDTAVLLGKPWSLLASGEFFFVMQQIYDLKSRDVVGREAFSRWRHKGELYLPEVFLPGMQENESVYALDRLMMEKVCEYLGERKTENELPIALNVEAIDVTIGDQARHLAELIRTTGIEPTQMRIEVPSWLCVSHYRDLCRFADQLFEEGIPLTVDNCGECPIDIDLLRRLHASEIKLSGRFSQHICSGRDEQEIVKRHAETAHKLGIPAVAKHIESDDQAVMYMTLGCERGQGYLFDHPGTPGARDIGTEQGEEASSAATGEV